MADFDRDFKRTGVAFGAWFAFCAVLSLGTLAFCAWAVVQLVQWITTK